MKSDEDYQGKIFLPLKSNVPSFSELKKYPAIAKATYQAYIQLGLVYKLLTHAETLKPPHIASYLSVAHDALLIGLSDVNAALKDSLMWPNYLAMMGNTEGDEFDIYDQYFNLIWYENEQPLLFVQQAFAICTQQVLELLHSPVLLTDIINGLQGMYLIFKRMYMGSGHDAEESTQRIIINYPIKDLGSENHVSCALRRWKIGHAYFALSLSFSRDELAKAKYDIAHLEDATLLLQASTAAMFLSSAFTPKMYLENIRPSMISTKSPHGFSGTQNRDFIQWRDAKDELITHFSAMNILSTDERKALKRFADAYFLDMERHIALAASMVADATSLMQEQAHQAYGAKMEKGAVEMLRDALEGRKQEFSFI